MSKDVNLTLPLAFEEMPYFKGEYRGDLVITNGVIYYFPHTNVEAERNQPENEKVAALDLLSNVVPFLGIAVVAIKAAGTVVSIGKKGQRVLRQTAPPARLQELGLWRYGDTSDVLQLRLDAYIAEAKKQPSRLIDSKYSLPKPMRFAREQITKIKLGFRFTFDTEFDSHDFSVGWRQRKLLREALRVGGFIDLTRKVTLNKNKIRETMPATLKMTLKEEIIGAMPEFNLIRDIALRANAVAVWEDAITEGGWTMEQLRAMPFSVHVENCNISFIEHVRTCCKMCVAVYDVLKAAYGERTQLNLDYLIAGALLADVGKLIEYESKDGVITKAGRGQHLRHPFTGVAMSHARGIPPEVQHIIATHSKEGDIMIRSNESVIFHHADFIDFDLVSKKRPF